MSQSAVAAAPRGPERGWANVVLMGCGHFMSDFFCDILPILLPVLALRFGLSYSECGALFMAFQVVASFLQPPIGLYADRHGIGWIMPASILTGAVFACAVTLVGSVWLLLAIILLSGFCSSGFHPVAGGIVPQIAPKGRDVLATSIFIAGGNIGFAIAPLVVAVFLDHFSDTSLPWLSLPAVLTAVLIFMRRLHVRTPSKAAAAELPSVHDILHNRDFMLLTLSIGLRSWCYCAFIMYLPLLLSSEGFSSVSSATAVMVMLLGTAAGGLAVGTAAMRAGLKKIIMFSYVLSFVFCALFLWRADLSAISYVALFLTGAGLYGSTPAAIVWSERLLSRQAAAFATSMMLGFTFGVGYMLSVITGAIGDAIGLQAAFAVTVLPALAAGTAVLAMLKDPRETASDL
jgi:FSR family fosmidomycin resistance protein-like MFS transporter